MREPGTCFAKKLENVKRRKGARQKAMSLLLPTFVTTITMIFFTQMSLNNVSNKLTHSEPMNKIRIHESTTI